MNNSYVRNMDEIVTQCLIRVFYFMAAALVVTGVVAYLTATSPYMLQSLFGAEGDNPMGFYVLLGVQLLMVIAISAGIHKLTAPVAGMLFFVYAALMGVTLSIVFLAYDLGTIYMAFFITAGTFGAMAVYGATTKNDLSEMGSLLFMALIGLIIASVVNVFMQSSLADYVICWAGILIFVGLTAYDTQKTKTMLAEAASRGDGDLVAKYSILGALSLYLDFINLFLKILRILGKAKK